MMSAAMEQEMDPQKANPPLALIKDIQRKADGTFIVDCNGYPFHATAQETPVIHAQILDMLEAGEPCSEFVEPTLSEADLQAAERSWRDAELERWLWLRERHRDQQEIQLDTTLSNEHFSELLTYFQALRDWPQSSLFPASEQRPQRPVWLSEHLA